MEHRTYYTVYKTTCVVNGKIYIGFHETGDLDDGYLGSGKVFSYAVRLYGKAFFQKEILFIFDTFEEMVAKEGEIVDQPFVDREDTYNLVPGGLGGGFRHMNTKFKNDAEHRQNKIAKLRLSSLGEKNSQYGVHLAWVVREGERALRVPRETLNEYITAGWKNSTVQHRKLHTPAPKPDTHVCHPDGSRKFIASYNLQKYLDLGWQLGKVFINMESPPPRVKREMKLSHHVKITDEMAQEIVRIYSSGELGQVKLAQKFGVSQPAIHYILQQFGLTRKQKKAHFDKKLVSSDTHET